MISAALSRVVADVIFTPRRGPASRFGHKKDLSRIAAAQVLPRDDGG
jgi:hypothetical protein